MKRSKLARRRFLQSAAAAAALPALPRMAKAEGVRPLAERLADYADKLRFEDIDAVTVERVKSHVIDTIGCGIAAFDEAPVRVCRELALAPAGGSATIIGTARSSTPDLASFANGAAFRYYDLNDSYVGGLAGHPSDNISACLAVAESERADASALLTAIVLAYEIDCRLIDAFDVTARGWDPPVFSLPAVALAAGKLMKLPVEKLTEAVNLAINDHIPMGQTRTQANSDWKGFADAEAGRNAIFAAMLARGGITGPAPIFEGRNGFFQLVSGPADVDVGAFGGRGVPFKIHQCGMKAYPAVVYSQTAIEAGIAVAKEVRNLDRITAIEIATTRRGYEQAGRDREKFAPENRATADHSLPYITARAMLDGDISNDSYAPERLRDPRIRALIDKMTVKEDPTFAKPPGNAPSNRITAVLDDGQRITRQVNNMPGFPGQPMSRADVERKFRGNVGKRWPEQRTTAVLQGFWGLDRTENLRALLGGLSLQG
jgi:2-methylcitrate dehydratase